MTLASLDANALIGAIAVVVSIFGGGLMMAWRLGALERSVKDIAGDVNEVKEDVKSVESHVSNVEATANAAASAATAAATSVGIIANRSRRTDV